MNSGSGAAAVAYDVNTLKRAVSIRPPMKLLLFSPKQFQTTFQ